MWPKFMLKVFQCKVVDVIRSSVADMARSGSFLLNQKKKPKTHVNSLLMFSMKRNVYFKGAKACIHNGRKLTKHELGFRKVKSIFKVKCWNYQSFSQDLSWKTKMIILDLTHYQSYCKEKVLLFVICTTFQHM